MKSNLRKRFVRFDDLVTPYLSTLDQSRYYVTLPRGASANDKIALKEIGLIDNANDFVALAGAHLTVIDFTTEEEAKKLCLEIPRHLSPYVWYQGHIIIDSEDYGE